MLIAVLAAAAAGACFAVGGILQQRVASTRPEGESLSPRLLQDLVRQRLWLAGIALAFLSYGFQALALAFGPLSLVQPILVSELLFALPVSARLGQLKFGIRSWLGAVAVASGLAAAIAAASPSQGNPSATTTGWAILVAAVVVTAAVSLLVSRRVDGPARASLFAAAGAVVMGAQSALFAVTIAHLQEGVVPLFTAWQTYLLVVASIGGLLLLQSAYQSGPLGASMPVIDTVEPAVAIIVGVVLFQEALADGMWRHVIAGLGVVLAIVGIVTLDTSPVMQRLHRQEREARSDGEDEQDDQQVSLRSSD